MGIWAISILAALLFAAAAAAQFDQFGGGEQQWMPDDELVDASVVFSVTSARAGSSHPAAVVVNMQPGWHINSAAPLKDWLIPAEVRFDTGNGLIPHDPAYPAGHREFLSGDTMSVYSERAVIPFMVSIADTVTPGTYTLPVDFTYQPCDAAECRPPQTVRLNLSVTVGDEGEAANTAVFAGIEDHPAERSAPPPTPPAEEENELMRLIEEHGFWGYILAFGLAFITGLLLSFSPCTYPMIPITVSVFAGQQRSVARGFFLSLIYVGSMAVMYGIMGLIVSLVGGVFGAWLASTPVVIAISIVFVIFALSMFGVYELQVPSGLRQKLGGKAHGGGVVGSMVLGVIAALVVSPCVGPFVAGILIYVATSGSPVIGFFVLFVFALGLGTLYVLIGTFSSALAALPNSGQWMESVKKFFGFVLLLMALYFLRTIIPPHVTALLAGLLLVAFGVFGGGLDRLTPDSTFFPRLKKFLGVLALLLGAYLLVGIFLSRGVILDPASRWLPAGGGGSVEQPGELIAWEKDLEEGLARAARENKPVLIDTWATWCANCRVLDRETFGNPAVAEEAERFVPIKVQLENAGTPITIDFMERFGMSHYSLPTVLLLDSSGNVQRILRGVVGPEDMIAAMRQIN